MGFFKRPKTQAITDQELPPGWHDGTVSSISIHRRQGKKVGHTRGYGPSYQPSGWDLVDVQSGQVIAEYNDETAPAPINTPRKKYRLLGRVAHEGQVPTPAFPPPTGNELGEMFQAIYMLCYNTTIEAMRLAARALPEHEHSEDGEPIAVLQFKAFAKLPQTMGLTNKQAYQQGYGSTYTGQEPF